MYHRLQKRCITVGPNPLNLADANNERKSMTQLRHIKIHIAVPETSKLGEGVMWDAACASVRWVDILDHRVYTYHPSSGDSTSMITPAYPSAIVAAADGGYLLAAKGAIYRLAAQGHSFEWACDLEAGVLANRCNDGKCDPQGRLWVGTMAMDESAGAGSLYRMDSDLKPQQVVGNLTISNGMAWDSSRSLFYHIDTPTRSIFAYDYESTSGAIANKRTVIRFEADAGWPDGMTIDETGRLWIAMWDGWSVVCVDPTYGRVLTTIDLPVARPTNCTFGGAGLDEMYVTTASTGLHATALKNQPHAGALFVVRGLGASGIVTANFNNNI